MAPLPSPLDPAAPYLIAEALLAAALPAVTAANGAPGISYVNDGGTVVFDDCCDGQLWVSWQTTTPTLTFPTAPPLGARPFQNTTLVLTYQVGIVRCAPTQDEDGEPPTPAEIQTAAHMMHTDAWALLGAVTCLLKEWDRLGGQVQWTNIVPVDGGGCLGSIMTVLVGMPLCPCQPS